MTRFFAAVTVVFLASPVLPLDARQAVPREVPGAAPSEVAGSAPRVVAGPAPAAVGQPNFSGTWKLAKQDPPPRPPRGGGAGDDENRGATRALEVAPVTLKIVQNGNDMTFESTMSDGWVRALQFKLDFSYTVNPLPPGGDGGEPRLNGPTKTRGRWMGNRLFLHQTQGLGQRRDILTIDGDVLSIQRDYETPGGAGTTFLTFSRVTS